MIHQSKFSTSFWIVLALVALSKLVFAFFQSPSVVDVSLDDSGLYIKRAFFFLLGEGWGPYHPDNLSKFPAMSMILVFSAFLGIPYLFFFQGLYVSTSLYFIWSLRRFGISQWGLLIFFSLLVWHPFSFSKQVEQVFREPIEGALLLALLAAFLHLNWNLERRKRVAIAAMVVASTVASLFFLREEGPLVVLLLLLLTLVSYFWHRQKAIVLKNSIISGLRFTLCLSTGALLCIFGMFSLLSYKYYGQPHLSEMAQGEYPKFVRSLRKLRQPGSHPYAHISFGQLRRLSEEVPRFKPVYERLYKNQVLTSGNRSCRFYQICDALVGAESLREIRLAAFQVGLTPDLVTSQNYFRQLRTKIDLSCQSGKLSCRSERPAVVLSYSHYLLSNLWRVWSATWNYEYVLAKSVSRTYSPRSLEMWEKVVGSTSQFSPDENFYRPILTKWTETINRWGPYCILFGWLFYIGRFIFFNQLELVDLIVVATGLFILFKNLALSLLGIYLWVPDRLFMQGHFMLSLMTGLILVQGHFWKIFSMVVSSGIRKLNAAASEFAERLEKRMQSSQLLLIFATLSFTHLAGAKELKIPVKTTSFPARFVELLKFPPAVAMGLQNAGYRVTSAGSLSYPDWQTVVLIREIAFPFHRASLRYIGNEGPRFNYEIDVDWRIWSKTNSTRLSVVLDLSNLNAQFVDVIVDLPNESMGIFGKYLKERIAALLHRGVQDNLIEYYTRIEKQALREEFITPMMSAIMKDGYAEVSKRPSSLPSEGPIQLNSSVSNIFVGVTLLFWVIFIPAIVLRRIYNSAQLKKP